MANQRRLKKLCLSFVKDVPLPGFSEALTKFSSLTHLELSNIDLKKINFASFFECTSQQLTTLKLDRVDLSTTNVQQMLRPGHKLRFLCLSRLSVDLDFLVESLITARLFEIELDTLPGNFTFTAFTHCKKLTITNIKIVGCQEDQSCATLKSLAIQRCTLDLKSLIGVLQTFTALHFLGIRHL